MIYKLRKL